jgi:hypothetical protein
MGIADDLIRQLSEGADDAMRLIAHAVAAQADQNAPKGDPEHDPDPEVTLHAEVEKDGDGYVVIFREPYAAKQEFDLNLKHPRGGGPRYLQRAVAAIIPQVSGIIASQVDARMAGGLNSDPSRSHHKKSR